MAVKNSTLQVSLLDKVSGPARGISAALSGINKSVSGLTSPLRGIMGQVIGLGVGYLGITQGLKGTYTSAADAQSALSEIGIKAGLSQTQLGQMQQRLVALSPKVNQFTSDLTAGVDVMTTMGASVEQAIGAIPAIGKAATATGASIEDLSTASVSAMQNLKVLPSEIAKAIDGLAFAGNAGAFELKDMAQYIPALGAAYQGLGQSGVGSLNDLAAALQIVRKGTGDSASAAGNLGNVLQKINAPQTRAAFKKMGINLSREMDKASKLGMSPIEAVAEVTNKTLKGNLANLGDLFADSEVQKALRPLIQNMAEYRKIRDGANSADGTVLDAYARRMQDANEKTKAFKITVSNLGTAIGARLLAPIGKMADELSYSLNTLDGRFGVFDSMKASVEGFASAFGASGIGGIGKSLNDFVFGIEDGGKAADKYGLAFKKFREYGQDVKVFTDALSSNPTAKFLTELGLALGGFALSNWFKMIVIASGIKAVIDAARDAHSLTEFTANLKGLSALEWAGVAAGLLIVARRAKSVAEWFTKANQNIPKTPSGAPGAAPAGANPGATAGAFSIKSLLGGILKGGVQAAVGYFGEMGIRKGFQTAYGPDYKEPPGLTASIDNTFAAWRDLFKSVATNPKGRGDQTSPLYDTPADDGSVSLRPDQVFSVRPTGVQQVAVTNPVRPNISVKVSMSNSFASGDAASAGKLADAIGAAAKASIESNFSDGGGF
ncbi:MAG: phage tail tape measure protein [Allorhizobium sp.]